MKNKNLSNRHQCKNMWTFVGPWHEQQKAVRILDYNKNPTTCQQCGKSFPYEKRNNKYCDRSCAAKCNNALRSPESREKQRQTVTETMAKYKNVKIGKKYEKNFPYTKLIWNTCVQCNISFYTLKYSKKTCSKKCCAARQVEAGKISGKLGGKASAAKRCLRSKDEIQLYELCEKHFDNIDHNKIIVDGWDADILLNDFKIAILWNGPWHYKEMPGLKHSLKQVQNRDRLKQKLFKKHGWGTIIFEDRHFTPESAFEKLKEELGGGSWI